MSKINIFMTTFTITYERPDLTGDEIVSELDRLSQSLSDVIGTNDFDIDVDDGSIPDDDFVRIYYDD